MKNYKFNMYFTEFNILLCINYTTYCICFSISDNSDHKIYQKVKALEKLFDNAFELFHTHAEKMIYIAV
jgi:hypothetical protein